MYMCLCLCDTARVVDYDDSTDWSEWRNHFWIDVHHGNAAITGSCKHCKVHFNSMTSRRGLAHVHKVENKGIQPCKGIPDFIRAKLKPWKFAAVEDEGAGPTSQSSLATGMFG